jgi:SAM-dependent methyltransferase
MSVYQQVADLLDRRGLAIPHATAMSNIPSMLHACDSVYLTEGVRSLEAIPADSVDWIWSQAVLEHVRLGEVDRLLAAMRRIVRKGGIISHRIDLQDHLGGGLNNLRFSDSIWENDNFAFRGGFYTNRIRSREWLSRIELVGFEVEKIVEDRWPRLPIRRSSLASKFSHLMEEDLRVRGLTLIMRAC